MTNLLSSIPRRCSLFIAPILLLFWLLAGCSNSGSFPLAYTATIAEGRSAATQVMEQAGASSISLAFVDGDRLVWAETFGYADKDSKTAPTADTMYCIGSTSKMIATIAVMKLVDQGLISLDAPLIHYLPSFSMASPEYTQITVRMLLNHSSGFPGTDYRNGFTASPLSFGYSAQVLETLKTQRLKHPPGYMSVYCNDGFTVVEQLVSAVAKTSYVRFVQDQILTPLGMNHSRYSLDYFPEGSFAKRYDDQNMPLPQMFVNALGSGGLYSTPTDMAKVAMMLIGGGKFGGVPILSEDSIAEMGVDQTLTNFNPVKKDGLNYGLGWDTVTQPGLGAVGVTGWQKGGSIPYTKTTMSIAPAEKLAVIVIGASNGFSSDHAIVIAERILLRALAEKGRIAAMPVPLNISPRPEKTPTDELLNSIVGYYANMSALLRVQRQTHVLNISEFDVSVNSWKDLYTGLKLRDDDRFSSDDAPFDSFSFITSDGRQYIIRRNLQGYGHYQDNLIYAQKVSASGALPAAWSNRLGRKWLLTNDHHDSILWPDPVRQLTGIEDMLFSNSGSPEFVNPFFSDSRAGMALLIPQVNGRDLNDVVIETRGGEEWLRTGSSLYRPLETIQALTDGTITIGTEGMAEWRVLDAMGIAKTVTITPAVGGHWKIYDIHFRQVETGEGAKSVTLSAGRYYLIFHDTANVNIV